MRATFESPFVDGDEYVVELAVERLGNSSISYTCGILDGDVVVVTGAHTVVHLDGAGRPTPVPQALRDVLEKLVEEESVGLRSEVRGV